MESESWPQEQQIEYWLGRKKIAERALAYSALRLASLGYTVETVAVDTEVTSEPL